MFRTLRPGDLVRLVSPAGAVRPDPVAVGAGMLTDWGLRVEVGRFALGRHGLFSGTDDERLADLVDALTDPEVRGVLCTRGGYGAQRLLEGVPFEKLIGQPKAFVGFSDITALHVALEQLSGWSTLHGPALAWNGTRNGAVSRASLRAALFDGAARETPWTVRSLAEEATAPLTWGTAVEGTVRGGNLTLLAAGCGTPYGIRTDGPTILFLEEVNEPSYRVDRLLTQLRLARVLDGVVGIALGQFVGCEGGADRPGVVEVLREWAEVLGVPCVGGLPAGHGNEQQVVVIGARARLDPVDRSLTFLA